MTGEKTGITSEANVMKIVTGLVVAGVIWCVGTISTLVTNDGMQEIHIQNGIETDKGIMSSHAALSERVARQESDTNGLSLTLAIVIKNQDRILAKLEKR